MKRNQKMGVLLFLGVLAGGVSSMAAGGVADIARQAERTTEDQQAMTAYYKYSRDAGKAKPDRSLTVQTPKAETAVPTLSFEVREVRVTKSRLLTDAEIQKAIHFKGSGASNVAELQAMVDRLNALYIEKGIPTAQAVLPPQTVQDGVVYIRLIEGVYGKTEISGNRRIYEETIRHRIRTESGDLVNVDRLREDLLRYNATNTYQIRAELVPGEEEGTSDLHLHLEETENPVTSFLFADNAGQSESGRTRIGMYTEYRGIGGRDAALSVAPVWTQGIWGGTVAYDTPFGPRGTRVSASYSRNWVDILHGTFRNADMAARSNDVALTLTHPLSVSLFSKTDIFVEGHRKWSDTTYSGMGISDNLAKTVRGGFNTRKFDRHGAWFFSGSVTGYDGDDNFRKTEHNGAYYNAYLLRRQNLPSDQYLSLRLVGQYTGHKNLPTTEQFTLGGMTSVRGFKESALSGDKGWLGSLEYGFPVSADHRSWRGVLFWDYGIAYNNYSLYTEKENLASVGLGLEYAKGGWYGKAVAGFPLVDTANVSDETVRFHVYLQRNI